MRVYVEAMFFDGSRDYLPHFRKFEIDIDPEAMFKELLFAIKQKDEEFDFDTKYPLARIGSYVVPPAAKVGEVVERFGDELRIEAAFKYRSINDLVMDEEDFEAAFKLIEPYASMEDRFFFASNKDLHYASATLEFDKSYIGDAVLITAHRMIKRGNPHKEEILRAISEDVSGLWSCEYENLVFKGKDYTEAIEELKSWATPPKPGLTHKICSKFTKKKGVPKVERLEGVPVALYGVDGAYFKEQGAHIIEFARATRRAGESLVDCNPELAYKKGAALLLDAMDNGAELLVTDKKMAEYFRSNFSHFEKASGREIYIEIITPDEIKNQLKETNASGV